MCWYWSQWLYKPNVKHNFKSNHFQSVTFIVTDTNVLCKKIPSIIICSKVKLKCVFQVFFPTLIELSNDNYIVQLQLKIALSFLFWNVVSFSTEPVQRIDVKGSHISNLWLDVTTLFFVFFFNYFLSSSEWTLDEITSKPVIVKTLPCLRAFLKVKLLNKL